MMGLAQSNGRAAEPSSAKPVLLYSRHYNAVGENRYAPDGVYSQVLQSLGESFDVRVNADPITPALLSSVKLLLICNPSDQAFGTNAAPPHISETDIGVLTNFVENGGGLIVMENQENHNLEVREFNRLLARFGITALNLCTDAKRLVLPRETPLIGGLRWAYYSGNLLLIDRSHRARPQALVMNDLGQPPINGTRDQPGVLLATAQPGKGRIAIVTDSGWIANWALNDEGAGGNVIQGQDNLEIFRRLTRWTAGVTN